MIETTFHHIVGWMPGWASGLILLAVSALVAISVHGLIVRLLIWILGERHPFLNTLLARARGPTRFAVMLIALSLALPAAPFDADSAVTVRRIITVAYIALAGWIALAALDLGVNRYLKRFRLDVEDNLLARKHVTQTRLLRRTAVLLIILIAFAAGMMTFEPVRQYGVSLLAAGGAAGIILGLAAQPILSNLFAGLQLALTQPIRLDDAVIVEGEWGTIEEIHATFVVVKVWDWRRIVVPLRYFIEQPFQNWTRETAALIGVVTLHVDYGAPVEALRRKLKEIAAASPLCDKRVINLQVVEALEHTIQLRALVSARNAPSAWDLRCEVREKLIAFLQQEHPQALPRRRAEISLDDDRPPARLAGDGNSRYRRA